jgi:hypothetical protein
MEGTGRAHFGFAAEVASMWGQTHAPHWPGFIFQHVAALASCLQDVWDMCWASDNPELLAIMEKGRLVVLRGSEAEEPITSSAWLAGFSDLQVGCSETWLNLLHCCKECTSMDSAAYVLSESDDG